MNLVERFVLKIHHVSENAFGYTLIADIDDYGVFDVKDMLFTFLGACLGAGIWYLYCY